MTQISWMSDSLLTASAIPAVLVAGATAMQNCTFPSLAVTITVATIFCSYSRRDGQAELAWVACFTARWFICLVTHPTTN